ncbi:MAG TPA: hypothetical protein VMJ75_09610 [Candidatus Acidoferrales bacterium]|nr:hypothetical protein [Candidatus Acidoferrales bacterium]
MKNKIVVAAVVAIAVFLIGFVPEFVKVNRLEDELRKSVQEKAGYQLRELISLAYFQATQKNFGLAAETSSQFFGRAREMTNQAQDATSRKALEGLLASRDKVTAALAKGDAAAVDDLRELFVKTRQATGNSSRP